MQGAERRQVQVSLGDAGAVAEEQSGQPATTSRQISSRSTNDNVRLERDFFGGLIPPVCRRMPATEPWSRSKSCAIFSRESPFC